MSKPRFEVHIDDDYVAVWDDDFGYDATLEIRGDFGAVEKKIAYAQAVADALNKVDIPKGA